MCVYRSSLPPSSPSICTPSQVAGELPQLGSHAFSKTKDFYQNDNELMTHGGLWALERNQRTTGDRVKTGDALGQKDLVLRKPIPAQFRS